jgi:hypothetical protein
VLIGVLIEENNSGNGRLLLDERATVVERVLVEDRLEVGGRDSKV